MCQLLTQLAALGLARVEDRVTYNLDILDGSSLKRGLNYAFWHHHGVISMRFCLG